MRPVLLARNFTRQGKTQQTGQTSTRSEGGLRCDFRRSQYPGAQQITEGTGMSTAVEEKDAIREGLAEYCFRLDDGRFAEMAALFTEDGTWDTAFGTATGRAAIAELARSLRERAGEQRPRAAHLV